MKLLETDRLLLRPLTLDDAAFMLELLNEPAWLRYIGDRNVRTLDDARAYISKGPLDHYARLGFGHFAVVRKKDAALLGICGLIKRDTLDAADLGFAFLDRYRREGYAQESSLAVLADARSRLRLARVVAVASPDNSRSIALLEKLGFRFERALRLTEGAAEIKLFACNLEPAAPTPAAHSSSQSRSDLAGKFGAI